MPDALEGQPAFPEVKKVQLQQAVETCRAQLTLLVQILIALVIADVSVTGYAVNSRSSALLGIGAVLPLSMLFVGWTVSRLTIPFLYTAVRLEADFNAGDGLVTTFLSFTESVTYIHEMQSIAKLEDAAVRVERLKHLAIPHLTRNGRIRGRFLLMLIAAAHVCASTSLSLWFGWPVFGK